MKRGHESSTDGKISHLSVTEYQSQRKYKTEVNPGNTVDHIDPASYQIAMYNSYVASLSSYYSTLQSHPYTTHPYVPTLPYYHLPVQPPSSSTLFYQQQLQQATSSTLPNSKSSSPLPPSRTIYLGNITETTKYHEIFDLIKCGPVVEVKILYEKKCAFIEFFDLSTSLSFFNFYSKSLPVIPSSPIPLKVAFAKSSNHIPLNIQSAMSAVPPATRVAYVGGLDDSQLTESYLMEKFTPYGVIESIRMLKEKKTAFIHFISVSSAIKLVTLFSASVTPVSIGLPGSKICYGKDRFPTLTSKDQKGIIPSAFPPKSNQTHIPMSQFSTFCMQNSSLFKVPGVPAPFTQSHRSIILACIPENIALSDLANVIRGGPLFELKIDPEKNTANVTFVKASDALLFYINIAGLKPAISVLEGTNSKVNISSEVPGLFVKGKKIFKIGFDTPVDMTTEMLDAIEKGGATRNICISVGKQSNDLYPILEEIPDESTIITEFSQYGVIESVVRVLEKQIAFVNFANLVAALKAIVGPRANPIFDNFNITFGKDRCALPQSTVLLSSPPVPNLIVGTNPSSVSLGTFPLFNLNLQ